MRAVLFFTILALAYSAFNSSANYQGFVDQLQLANSTSQTACKAAIVDLISIIQKASDQTNPEYWALAAVNLYIKVKETTIANCAAFSGDLLALALKKTTIDNLPTVVQTNAQRYSVELTNKFALWAYELSQGRFYEAGIIEASIFQILVGLEVPVVLPVDTIKQSEYVALNYTKLLQETYGTYLAKIGMTKADIDAVVQCSTNLPTLNDRLNTAVNTIGALTNVAEQLKATKPVYADIIKSSIPCIKAAKASLTVNAPQLQALIANPQTVIIQILMNVGLNLPRLVQAQSNIQVNIQKGNYTKAGELLTQIHQTVYNQI